MSELQDAPFTSCQAAMNFAYRHAQGDYAPNVLARLQAPRVGGSKPSLIKSATDAAIIAGWVRMVIEGSADFPGLPEPLRSVMLAKFSVDSKLNLPAKLTVLEYVLAEAMGTGLHKRRMVDLCVQRYFGGTVACADGERRPIRQHQVADWCEVSQPTVSNAYVRIKAWIEAREAQAMDLLEFQLRGRGLVA
ncbi:MAG: hypothetical protein V4614_14965 [Pseudomonadota bacterium]